MVRTQIDVDGATSSGSRTKRDEWTVLLRCMILGINMVIILNTKDNKVCFNYKQFVSIFTQKYTLVSFLVTMSPTNKMPNIVNSCK